MADDTQTTGTPAQDDGDAGESQTTGTPEADGRDAGESENLAKLNLEWKAKAERTNAAETEVGMLKAQIAALSRSAQSPAALSNGHDPRAERLAKVRGFADGTIGEGPDPVAGELMDLRQELSMALNEIGNMRQLDRISDDTERQAVLEHFNQNRSRLGDITAARAEIRERKLDEQNRAQAEELEKLRKQIALTAAKRNPDVVRTHNKEVSAQEHNIRKMTGAEWASRQEQLEQADFAGDADARKTRMDEQLARRAGRLKVEG